VLVTTFKSLQKSNVSLVDLVNLFKNIIVKFQNIPGENEDKIKIKID